MKKFFLFTCMLFSFLFMKAQQTATTDTLKKALAKATDINEKANLLDNLSRILMNVNPTEAEMYGEQLITLAEESRDRELMVKAYQSNGTRCMYFATQQKFASRSIEYYNKALTIAKQNKMEEKIGEVQLQLSNINLLMVEKDKALSYANQAFSLISTLSNDSLLAEAHNCFGRIYISRNEKTLALRHFFNAVRIAEDIKAGKSLKANLLRNGYLNLSAFYSGIEDYDKAIDYSTKAYKQLDNMSEKNVPFQRAIDINNLGNLFAAKKNNDIAISYFERSVRMADSLKFPSLKVPAYISILNQYLRVDEPAKALNYLNSPSGKQLKSYLVNFGMSAACDQAYGYTYAEMGQYDSARIYFDRAFPFFDKSTNETNKVSFYRQLAGFYKKSGETKKAIEYFIKVKEIGEAKGMLEYVRNAAKNLDSLYLKSGDLKTANLYNVVYYQYKDSIDKLNKENELAQIEALDEQQRLDRKLAEEVEAKEKRNRIQYMGIVIAIAALFIGLVMMGWFKVSANTIRAIGFFAFLLFFEFIFLVFKKNIYGLTKGEPMYDLLFMIALAAILVPLHHWLEHKVIHFLTSHHMLRLRGIFSKKTG
ncbi:MAG: tetratricopeptide repeat protein [Bacteroidetes bacterium]|nr:MAG: tetratricopeptide repeat protein [Bacteroidota bacterium]